jgi:hypothetical protein
MTVGTCFHSTSVDLANEEAHPWEASIAYCFDCPCAVTLGFVAVVEAHRGDAIHMGCSNWRRHWALEDQRHQTGQSSDGTLATQGVAAQKVAVFLHLLA